MTQPQLQSSAPVEATVVGADVVVGVPTYNNASGVIHALRAVQAACGELAGAASCAIVHADGASTDGTVDRAAEVPPTPAPILQIGYPIDAVDRMAGPYRGVPAKGNAVRAIFDTARRMGAKACAIVDPEFDQFAPGWLDALVGPVLAHGRDFVAPYYARHRFGGAINNGVVYPLIRALYGKRVRHPMGGDFACSLPFIDRCIADPSWNTELVKAAVDIWLTTRALTDGSRVAQAFLGVKHQAWREQGGDAAEPLGKVLPAVFEGANRRLAVWQKVRGSEPVQMFGNATVADDAPVTVSVKHGIESFRLGQKHLGEVWKLVLPPRTLLELNKLAQLAEPAFRMPDDLWARVVYDFMLAYHQRVLNRDHLVSALAPLFAGWVASFACELHDATPIDSEDRLERMCLRFESEKPYLISRWRWPDRFSP
ncbi:MAG TPA: hypothetical protein VFZ21_04510 [Gemmatimonadaceae bacterium]|jgi:hypothetical protein|nr:hypothetical protein [Gemmatimonadaceae bacterium]